MRRIVITVLLVIFAILTLISSFTLYYTHQLPTEKRSVDTLYTYGHYGTFNHIATLKPNTIYNKTTLEPDEGPIFTKITDRINVNFTYTFQGTKPANLTIHYNVSEYVETTKWQKQIGEIQQKTINTTGTSTNLYINNIPPINISSVQNLVNTIKQETGMSVSDYIVSITTQMHIEANTTEGLISESFTPNMTITFTTSFSEGDAILIQDIEHIKTGEITSTEIIYQPWVNTQRYASYALSIVSFSGLFVIIWAFARSRPPKPMKPEALIEEVIEPFKEIISETAEEPQFKERRFMPIATISMKTLEDLVKVADTLAKPIIHTRKPPETHIFYVIDETTRYEYTMTESSIIERMTKEEEE